ncbi:hypothetical protein KAH81_04310 [bacterium]|nr:hypothetical protein [bacterium]
MTLRGDFFLFSVFLLLIFAALTASSTPPVPVMFAPAESVITTCEDEEVHIDLTSGSDIDISTIVFWVNSDSFTLDDDELQLVSDTLYFRPSGFYTYQTGNITVCLDSISDTIGVWSDEYCWDFFVDLEPPIMSNASPMSPPSISAFNFDIEMDIADLLLPVDSTTIVVQIIAGDETTMVDYDESYVEWNNPTLSFDAQRTGAIFEDGQQVTVRLIVRDLPPVTSDCAGNLLDTSFTFTLAETPCDRSPNPITPGLQDNVNDEVIFQFPNMRKANSEIHVFIYDLKNNQVADIDQPISGEWRWDGLDTAGEQLGQGTYIYLIKVDDETQCSGTINIAR